MSATIPKAETSHAILLLYGKYVLQLRDDKPDIAASGQWSLFGGKIDLGETPLKAMKRELFEELSIRPTDLRFLWKLDYNFDFLKGIVRTWFFVSNVENVWEDHELSEGKDVRAFSFNELTDLNIPEVMRDVLKKHHLEEK